MIAGGALYAYRAAAVRLREAAEWNRFDAEFQRGEHSGRCGRIVPLVDASIVKFFMDPENEAHLIDSFAHLQDAQALDGKGREAETTRLSTFARITAEFMFLEAPVKIGGEETQLWHEALLLAPGHAEETAAMLRSVERKFGRVYDEVRGKTEAEIRETDASRAVASVDAFSAAVQAGGLGVDHVRQLVDQVSGNFDRMFAAPTVPGASLHAALVQGDAASAREIARALEEAVRWGRLIAQGKLRPLLSHPLCTEEVLAPSEQVVGDLAKAIAERKRSAARAQTEPTARVMQRALHDATVVMQTKQMNDAARRADDGTGHELRFVLITADEGLHRVYAERFWRDADSRPEDFVLRRPLQFIPIMNAKDIPNGYRAEDLFKRLLSTLSSVTDFITQRTNGAFALEYDWRRQAGPTGARGFAPSQAAFEPLAELWREATTATNALCAGLAVHDFGIKPLIEKLDKLAGDARALTPLIQLHKEIYRDIDETQLPLIAQGIIVDAIGAFRRQEKAASVAGTRMPLLLRERFVDAAGDRRLEDFVARLARGSVAGSYKRLQETLTKNWSPHRVLFFAGAVAAISNSFERAGRHLSRAEELASELPSTDGLVRELSEISYLRCVVDRLSMRNSHIFRSIRKRLDKLVQLASNDPFAHARALSELGALLLTRYFNIQFDIETRAPMNIGGKMVEQARTSLDRALVVVQRLPKTSERAALINELLSQIHANSICQQVIASGFFEHAGPGRFPAAAADHLYALENFGGDRLENDHIVGLWGLVAGWLTAPPAQSAHKAAAVAEFCRGRLQALQALGADYQAPADAEVFTFIADRANAAA